MKQFSNLLLLIFFFLTGCGQAPLALPATETPASPEGSQFLETATPASSLPESPVSPVNPATAVPATIPTPREQVLEYASYGFRFTLPPGFRLVERPVEGDLHLSLGIAREADSAPGYGREPIGLRVFEKAETANLLDWFSAKQGDCFERGEQPRPGEYFISPLLENQDDFKGNPALRYESGCWPVPYETLIDRGRWVIALDYLRDYPSDYEAEYERILASLEFSGPAPEGEVSASPEPPPQAAPVCLDEGAQAIELPPRQKPLEVRFISDGDIWVWEEGEMLAHQVSDTGDARSFSFAPDGEIVLFTRGELYGQTELWAINRDGSGLRLLLSAGQMHALVGEPTTSEFTYQDSLGFMYWIEGRHSVGFEILRSYDAIGGCCESGGYWQVDVETGELAPWMPPPEMQKKQVEMASPDGKLLAISDDNSLSIADAEGKVLHENVFTFPTFPAEEGPGRYGPTITWSRDSQSLLAITFTEDFYSDQATFTTWWIPVSGEAAQELATFSGMPFTAYLSPGQEYLAYLKRSQPMSNNYELHLARFDGSKEVVYAQGHLINFWGWAADGVHFLFGQESTLNPQIGSLCGNPRPLLDPPVAPVTNIAWVDAERFLFVKGGYGDPVAELRLGQVGDGSILIGPFNGESAYYQFDQDEEALAGVR